MTVCRRNGAVIKSAIKNFNYIQRFIKVVIALVICDGCRRKKLPEKKTWFEINDMQNVNYRTYKCYKNNNRTSFQ